jgi:hypothetical protein
MPLFVAYALLAALALGAQPRVSDDVLWAAWFFVSVIAPVAALRGLWLLGSRMLEDRSHRAHQSRVDVGLCALTALGLIAQFWLVAAG